MWFSFSQYGNKKFQTNDQTCKKVNTKARVYTEAIAPVDYQFCRIRDHQVEYQIYIAIQEHHSRDQHPKGYPKNISFPISKEAAKPSQRNSKPQHVFDREATR
jgi:hypothetical protein